MRPVHPAVIGLLLSSLTAPLFAGDAAGRFTVDKKSIVAKVSTAYEVRDQSDGRKKAVEVLLATVALDPAQITSSLDPHVYAINSEAAKGDYILLWVRADGSVSMNATFSETMSQFLDNTGGDLKAELTENTPQRVAGHVWTPKPVKAMSGETWTVDVKFATAVTRAPAGTSLPADGGEAAKALEALYRAVGKKDWAGIKAGVAPDRMTAFEHDYNSPAENLKDAVETLGGTWLPKKHKVTGGELRGDGAILEVEGELYPGAKWLFLVRMAKGAAGWQFADEAPRSEERL